MAQQRMWSKAAEKKWRSTFTRENFEGERLLRYKLRNGVTPAQLAKAEKAQHLAREAKEDNEIRRLSREMVLDAIPGIQVDTGNSGFDYKARAGTKTFTIYYANKKVEQRFDEIGNLVEEVEFPL